MFSPEPFYFLSGVSKWCGLSDRARKMVFVREDIKKNVSSQPMFAAFLSSLALFGREAEVVL